MDGVKASGCDSQKIAGQFSQALEVSTQVEKSADHMGCMHWLYTSPFIYA